MQSYSVNDETLPVPYHKGYPSRASQVPVERRQFIAWDGEGMNLNGAGKPQHYVLFGASTGEMITGQGLSTFDLCDFIIAVGEANPQAIHVGFAFKYDANMIVKSLHAPTLKLLHQNGYVKLTNRDGKQYVLQFRPGKWFSVSRYSAAYSRNRNPSAKVTVRIFDLFGFFTCSFVKAVEDLLGVDAPGMDIVRAGKAERRTFAWDDMPMVETYWRAEIELLRLLADELRRRLYGAGLRITSWHGPGALATYAMREHGIKKHMRVGPDEVRKAARYAYAGGRFELFKCGRVMGPCYSVDINSAYPYAISLLPSLSEGSWQYTKNVDRIARFGVYHVVLTHSRTGFAKAPAPLFHRDLRHNISYPWIVEGWYWSPDVARLLGKPGVEIREGWEFLGSSGHPFSWVADMYETRRDWKAKGYPTQLALKLCMNSLYGKMAQRIGYDERTGRIPPWHQLEWAGWVTSYTRSMLYGVMSKIRWEHLIAVETDGIYTTQSPEKLGITNSTELGGWEVTSYDEMIYLQSGLAWLRKGDVWTEKRRGLDAGSMTLEDATAYAKSLLPNSKWHPYQASSTRFIGLGAALNSEVPVKVRHCVWQTNTRDVMPGEKGKRIHIARLCSACQQEATAYDMAHDLVIRSMSRVGQMSSPHSIPWEEKSDPSSDEDWRNYAVVREGEIV